MRQLLLPLLLTLGACTVSHPDDYTRKEIDEALDYRLDRTRVLSMRFDPPFIADGDTVEIEPLVLSPTGFDDPVVEGCGLRTDVPTMVFEAECLGTEELVFPIAEGANVSWESPWLRDAPAFTGCPEAVVDQSFGGLSSVCHSFFPIMATALGDDETARMAATFNIIVGYGGPMPTAAHQQDFVLVAPTTATAGETVDLEATWDPDAYLGTLDPDYPQGDMPEPLRARWYVDAGDLHSTGRTAWLERVDGVFLTRNALVIPADYSGPLRVVLIMETWQSVPDIYGTHYRASAWRIVNLAVSPPAAPPCSSCWRLRAAIKPWVPS